MPHWQNKVSLNLVDKPSIQIVLGLFYSRRFWLYNIVMKLFRNIITCFFVFFFSLSSIVAAQDVPTISAETESTESATTATQSATTSSDPILDFPLTRSQSIRSSDITDSTGETANRLELLLAGQQLQGIAPWNIIRHAIRLAVTREIPVTTIAFILLFPLIASLVAFSRHIVGLSGLSMYAPAAVAVVLISIGIIPGTVLFLAILLFSTVGKMLVGNIKLPYLPRTAMILWFVSIGVFGFLLLSTYITVLSLTVLNVFALLILMLLSENFLEVQSSSSPAIAIQKVFETFILGLLCALILGSELVQSLVLLYPEILLICIAVLNIAIGKYLGLRLTEWFRFHSLMETEE